MHRDHSLQVRNALALMRIYTLDGRDDAAERIAAEAKQQIDLYLLRLREQRTYSDARAAGPLPPLPSA